MDNLNGENLRDWSNSNGLAIKNGRNIKDEINVNNIINKNIVFTDGSDENLRKYNCVIELKSDGILVSSPSLYLDKQTNIYCHNRESVECINAYYDLLYGEQLIGLDQKDVIDATLESASGQFIQLHTDTKSWEESLKKKLSICMFKKCCSVLLNIVGNISLMDILPVADFLDEYFNNEAIIYLQGNYNDDYKEDECYINLWILE